MDIVDRLNFFLEQSGISKSQFADGCGIPRPTVSQILSGRNKKISDEIISKVHTIYPRLSIMWLMFGEGPMLNTIEDAHAINPSENSLFENKADDASNYSIVTDCANQEFSGKNIYRSLLIKFISRRTTAQSVSKDLRCSFCRRFWRKTI